MNEKRAKALRRVVYGDNSHKTRRYYVMPNGMRVNGGLRMEYQEKKKVFEIEKHHV